MILTSILGRTYRIFEEKEEQKPEKQPAQALADDRPHISEEQEKWLQQKMQEAQQKEKLEKQIRDIKSRWEKALKETQTKSPDGKGIKDFMDFSLYDIENLIKHTADRADQQQLYVAVKTTGRCLEVYDRQFPPEKGKPGFSDLYRANLAYSTDLADAISGNRIGKSIIDSYLHEDPARNNSKDFMVLRQSGDVSTIIRRDAQLDDIKKVPSPWKNDKDWKNWYEISTKDGTRLAHTKTEKQAEILKKDIEAALRQGEKVYDKSNLVDLEDKDCHWWPKYTFGKDYLKDNFATVDHINIDRNAKVSVEPVRAWHVKGSAFIQSHISFTGRDEGYGSKITDPKGFLYGYRIEVEGKTPFYENDTKVTAYTVEVGNHRSEEQAEKIAYNIRSEIEKKVRAGETIEVTQDLEHEKAISDDIDRDDGVLSADDLSERAGIDPFAEMEDLCDIPIDQRIKNNRVKAASDNAGREEKSNAAERKENTR